MSTVGIVGGGIFGNVIGRFLVSEGHDVTVFDADMPESGSRPAACLMKPSWFSKLPRQKEALRLLDEEFTLHDLTFRLPVGTATVHWVDPKKILRSGLHVVKQYVSQVHSDRVVWHSACNKPTVAEFDHVVCAAGVWTRRLVEGTDIEPRWGTALLWPGLHASMEPSISPWAPFRQIVSFDRGDGWWVGDGSAFKERMDEAKTQATVARCRGKVPCIRPDPVLMQGARPYSKAAGGRGALVGRFAGDVIVASGGAKNGTIGAAIAALEVAEMIG